MFKGLCVSCKKAPFCTFPRNPEHPVIQCDEFEGIESPPKKMPISPSSTQGTKPSVKKKDSKQYKGLCMICEKRETCTFPKPPGGVWHCDEYE